MQTTGLRFALAVGFILSLTQAGWADELKFGFVNPSFGGNPFNSSHLLGTAQAQNTFKEDVNVDLSRFNRDLRDTLNRPQIRIVGDTLVQTSVTDDGSTLIDIVDLTTGEVTQVVIP